MVTVLVYHFQTNWIPSSDHHYKQWDTVQWNIISHKTISNIGRVIEI